MQDQPRSRLSDSDYEDLREVFDGNESIMCGGMQVVAPRYTQVQHRKEEDTAPFLYNDAGTRKFLLKHFPLLQSDQFERDQARVWLVVIYRYFRLGLADRMIEEDLGWESGQVSWSSKSAESLKVYDATVCRIPSAHADAHVRSRPS
jgi:hypothetical protein